MKRIESKPVPASKKMPPGRLRRSKRPEILRCLSDQRERVSKNFSVTEADVRHFLHSRDLFGSFLHLGKNERLFSKKEGFRSAQRSASSDRIGANAHRSPVVMSQDFDLLDTVVLTEDVPEHDLQRGHVGTVVEQLAPDTYEVEFTDDDGTPYALAPLKETQLLKLRTTPRATP